MFKNNEHIFPFMIMPLTIFTDIDELGYYAVAENIEIDGHIVYKGNIVDSSDITFMPKPAHVRVPLQTNEGRYVNLASALSNLENLPTGTNALLFDSKDISSLFSKKEISGIPLRLKKLEISPIYRLRN